jgi:hypothetical protein
LQQQKEILMTNEQLAKSIRHGMFGHRKNYDEAMEYAHAVARATGETAAVMTAVQVVVNTIAEMILENERQEA